MTADDMGTALDRIAEQIQSDMPDSAPIAVIGIRRRGEYLADRLVQRLAHRGLSDIRHGTLDITLYRDDLAELGPQATVRGTEIDFALADHYVVLVDDVLYTGRSVRAAMNALLDFGRPRAIRLAVLVVRPGRELPIQADFVGHDVQEAGLKVSVCLPEVDDAEEVRLG